MRKIMFLIVVLSTVYGCSDARMASKNLSVAAEQFELDRRIVFFNGITDKYLLSITGKCSIEVQKKENQLEVTCKTGKDKYKKHHLGLSDNVTYFSEQLNSKGLNLYHYRVIFRPSVIVPEVDVK